MYQRNDEIRRLPRRFSAKCVTQCQRTTVGMRWGSRVFQQNRNPEHTHPAAQKSGWNRKDGLFKTVRQ